MSTNSENQATAAAREQIDFLYAAGKATAETPNVKLAFNHVMSRIKLTFTAGENVTLSDITCYLINLRTKERLIRTQEKQQLPGTCYSGR